MNEYGQNTAPFTPTMLRVLNGGRAWETNGESMAGLDGSSKEAIKKAQGYVNQTGFNWKQYLANYPDVVAWVNSRGGDAMEMAVKHYQTSGIKEGRTDKPLHPVIVPVVPVPIAPAPPTGQSVDKNGDDYISDVENTSGYNVTSTSLIDNVSVPATSTNPLATLATAIWPKYKYYIIAAGALGIWWFFLGGSKILSGNNGPKSRKS